MLRSLGFAAVGRWQASRRRASSGDANAKKAGTFSALRYRNYRLFWFGQLVSVTGTFMQGTAQQWLVLTLTLNNPAQAALALGIVGALQFGPLLLLGPFGGAIADRWPRRNILVGTQSAAGVLAVILFALTFAHVVTLWEVYLLALLLGFVNAVDMPTRQAFVTEMVPSEHLLNAISLNSAQFNASRIVGPGLAGFMIALFGMPLLFLLNAISYIAVIIGLLAMRASELMPVRHAEAAHGLDRLRQMGEGARFVFSRPVVKVTFLMLAVVGTLGFNFNVLLPLEASQVLHAGSMIFGLLTSALGVGALAGALLLARRGGTPTNRLLVLTAAIFGVMESAIALTHAIWLAMLLVAVTGFVMSMFSASANTRVQLTCPPDMRGRVMSVYTMVSVGTTPIGNLLVSSVATAGGVPLSFMVAGLPCFAAALWAAWLWRGRGSGAVSIARPQAQSVTNPEPEPASDVAMVPAVSDVVQPAQSETSPIAAPQLLVQSGGASRSYPARMPQRAPGHPKPQPRAADPD